MYCLDNEPMLWQEVHFDVHPEQTTYDEMLHMAVDYGAVVKEVDPTAKLHAYVLPDGITLSPAGGESTKAKRLESTRVLWDPDYMPGAGEVQDPPALIPRLR